MYFYNFSAPNVWRVLMAGYFSLSTLDHICGEWVGIMPSDEPPPAWSPEKEPSPRPWGEGLTQAARRRHWSKFQNWGDLCANLSRSCAYFGCFGYLCGLKWVKTSCKIDIKEFIVGCCYNLLALDNWTFYYSNIRYLYTYTFANILLQDNCWSGVFTNKSTLRVH